MLEAGDKNYENYDCEILQRQKRALLVSLSPDENWEFYETYENCKILPRC